MINRVEKFQLWHLSLLDVQPMQREEQWDEIPPNARLFSLFENDALQAVIGFIRIGPQRCVAVSLLSFRCGKHMLSIVRKMQQCYELFKTQRVEMYVKTDFAQAHRLAKLLGFTREGTLRKLQNGKDYDIYAKITEEKL